MKPSWDHFLWERAQDGRGEKEIAILEIFSLAVKVFCSDVLKE